MRNKIQNYPYPVLGISDAFVGDLPEVKVDSHIPLRERIADPYQFSFHFDLKNQDIIHLVETGVASYVCEITCSATLLRKCICSQSPTIDVIIGRKEVCRGVDFQLFVVTKQSIDEYENTSVIPEYKELGPFYVAAGAPLAILDSFHFDVDLCYEDLTSLRSIFQIKENTNEPEEEIKIDIEGEYIQILLPSTQYSVLKSVSNNPMVATVLHSSLILFALQAALNGYKRTGNDEQEGPRWFRALARMLPSVTNTNDELSFDNKEDIPVIVQRLLKQPFGSLFSVLHSFAETGTNTDTTDDDEEE